MAAKDLHERAAELMRSGAAKKAVVAGDQILVKRWQPATQEWQPVRDPERPEPPPRAA